MHTLLQNPPGMSSLWRPERRWKDNNEIHLGELKYESKFVRRITMAIPSIHNNAHFYPHS
jgi:hypothetical protein